MEELVTLIYEAWEKVQQKIADDPTELDRRLALRQSKNFRRPPRAWCLVIRASDRRIDDWFGWSSNWQGWHGTQEIELTANLVRKLTAPVATDRPYTEQLELAQKLGVKQGAIQRAAIKGRMERRSIPLLGGKRGIPVPVVYSKELLDPGFLRNFRFAHVAWGTQHKWLCEHVPDDLRQTVQREPLYRVMRCGYKNGPQPPVRDYVWYKWTKDGQYIEDKWDRRRERLAAWARRRRREKRDEPDPLTGQRRAPLPTMREMFMGWQWICPKCRRKVQALYLPLFAHKAWNLLGDADPPIGSETGMPVFGQRFLCAPCHDVRYSRLKNRTAAWNMLIRHASGGLLRGREVRCPDWFPKRGKSDWERKLEDRREAVRERLLLGRTLDQIAHELGITRKVALLDAQRIYNTVGVRSWREFTRKLAPGVEREGSRRRQVAELLKQGLSRKEIARVMGMSLSGVDGHIHLLYRNAGVHSRKQWMEKVWGPSAQGASLRRVDACHDGVH